MKFFIVFTLLLLFTITCYAEVAKPNSIAPSETVLSETSTSKTLTKQQNTKTDLSRNNALFYQKFYQIKQGLSQADFATTIKMRFAATDHFYRGLKARQQQKIYAYYKTDADFRNIRREIFDLYFN
ncbi:MAG: hypothetical protein ACWA5U_04350 [bacterium]